MSVEDIFDLERFVTAQDDGNLYRRAVSELREGHKRTHWMWFVFPQLAGLGRSATSTRYALRSVEEARAYLTHPILGRRLLECASIVASPRGANAREIFGDLDAQKLHSCMTLFSLAAPHRSVFTHVVDRHFGGHFDPHTEALLATDAPLREPRGPSTD